MSIPHQHRAWADALMIERPWEDNSTTQALQELAGDSDIAAVIWALARTNSLKWIDQEMPALGGKSIRSEFASSEGRARIWQLLQSAVAWM